MGKNMEPMLEIAMPNPADPAPDMEDGFTKMVAPELLLSRIEDGSDPPIAVTAMATRSCAAPPPMRGTATIFVFSVKTALFVY